MTYSKKVCEKAAQICAIAASTPGEWFATIERGLGWADGWSREYSDAHDVAVGAFREARARLPNLSVVSPILCAEAEALIRCGWSPGDEP